MNILLVTSSLNPNSASSHVAKGALSAAGLVASASLDTSVDNPPAYGLALMGAVYMGSQSAESVAAKAASDAYVKQLKEADVLVAAIPMHNFGVPSGFKAWMDQVARPGETFEYAAGGPRGLLSGKKALVIVASGGDYQGPAAAYEHAASHAKVFFGFLGMHVEVVAVPGQAGADAGAQKDAALAKATEILRSWK